MDSTSSNEAKSRPVEAKPKLRRNPKAPRQVLPVRSPEERVKGAVEVAQGFTLDQVRIEALRCLQCKDPVCVEACPLHINVKSFIDLMAQGNFDAAFQKISEESPFPGICGRVCQHELFCEKACLLGKKLEPVAIGSLERFAADKHVESSGPARRWQGHGRKYPRRGARRADRQRTGIFDSRLRSGSEWLSRDGF